MMSSAGNTDPHIDSLGVANQQAEDPRWLRTSPEFPMKRLLAHEPEPIYELGRVFRAGESGRQHNPEFTMLEWYRPGWVMQPLIDEVLCLLRCCFTQVDQCPDIQQHDYVRLFNGVVGVCPIQSSDQDLASVASQHGLMISESDRATCIDYLMAMQVQPALTDGALHVISRYPADQAALARIDPDDHSRSLRFEVFFGSIELANGYDELCDADQLATRFKQENQVRVAMNKSPMPVDHRLLAALEHGLPACSGVAMGIDRLLMCLQGAEMIAQVINFTEEFA